MTPANTEQQLEAHQPLHLLARAPEEAPSAASPPARAHTNSDRALDVDAGGRRQVGVVGDGPHRLADFVSAGAGRRRATMTVLVTMMNTSLGLSHQPGRTAKSESVWTAKSSYG